MNIAIVGGGKRCLLLLKAVKSYPFQGFHPRVVAIANDREDPYCVAFAKEEGIFVTEDYRDLLGREDIDVILESTGREEVFEDLMQNKKKHVRLFDSPTAEFFWEMGRMSQVQEATRQELEKAKTLYNLFINDLLEEDVMVISPDYTIIDINETLARKLGLDRKDVVGRTCYEISHHQDHPCEGEDHPCPLVQTVNTQKSSRTTHVHRDKDGRELHYSISCYPIFEDGKVVAAVELSRDISKDIGIQKMMMQQEKLASIGRLAAGVAHEINNPMTTILTTAMLIQEDMEKEDPNYEELQTIVDETLRCRKIVNSLLSFARQARSEKKNCDVNEIITESMSLTRKQAAFKDVSMEHELGEGLPRLYLDSDQIQQALINLALNAIEATEAGGVIRFSSRLADDGDWVEIMVSDTGTGISPENVNRIFEPFYTTKETGTGLGMAITHGLIEQHGGKISVESVLGAGTTFVISLPVKGRGDHGL